MCSMSKLYVEINYEIHSEHLTDVSHQNQKKLQEVMPHTFH